MNRKFFISIFIFLQLCVLCFGSEPKLLLKYQNPGYMDVMKVPDDDWIQFGIMGKENEGYSFTLINSGFTEEDAVKILKKVYLQNYDVADYMTASLALSSMNYCLLEFLTEKYGSAYTMGIKYEFELIDIKTHENFKHFKFGLKMK